MCLNIDHRKRGRFTWVYLSSARFKIREGVVTEKVEVSTSE